jgi:hypothetical protein
MIRAGFLLDVLAVLLIVVAVSVLYPIVLR